MAPQNQSRKFLCPVSPSKIRRTSRRNEKDQPTCPRKVGESRLLSPYQIHLARYLAIACPPRQRRNSELLYEMEKRRAVHLEKETEKTLKQAPRQTPKTLDAEDSIINEVAPPLQHPACGANWRARASARLRSANITLEKEWSSKTWSNKTNVPERLFLLEADGVDITALHHGSIGSAQVTRVIMDRIEERKKRASPFKPPAVVERTQVLQAVALASDATVLQAETVASHDQPVVETEKFENREVVEQLEYRPKCSPSRKRKCGAGYVPTKDPSVTANSHAPLRVEGTIAKKVRIQGPSGFHVDGAHEVLRMFKKNMVRDIFRSPQPLSNILIATVTIHFPPNDEAICGTPIGDIQLSSRGFANILNEVRFLADKQYWHCKSEHMVITDPDFEEQIRQITGVPAYHDDSSHRISGDTKGPRSIHVQTTSTKCVVEGDSHALQGLLRLLQDNDLLHLTTWKFDGLRMVPGDSMTWSLSGETQSVLGDVRRRLQAGGGAKERNVDVRWVYTGETCHA